MTEQFTREELAKTYQGAVFLHYKGGIYRAIMEAKDTDTGRNMVVYEHLYPHPRSYYVRAADEFLSEVTVDGVTKLRFKPIGVYAQAFSDRITTRGI